MYEWSKNLTEKINKANCLPDADLRMVELALRLYEIHNDVLDECIGASNTNNYELTHKIQHAQKGHDNHENEIKTK